MEDEVAALVSVRFPREKNPVSRIQVIDNGSGMCKAGCKSIFWFSSTISFADNLFQLLVSLAS